MQTVVIATIASLALVACTSTTTETPCHPSRVADEPTLPGEAQARATAGFEAWSLWFTDASLPAGEPVSLPAGADAKVVWSVTGEGEFTAQAEATDGTVMELDWGPDPHSGSNWEVPGDEWGTGWTFSKAGCWIFTITRGSDTAEMTVLITEA